MAAVRERTAEQVLVGLSARRFQRSRVGELLVLHRRRGVCYWSVKLSMSLGIAVQWFDFRLGRSLSIVAGNCR